MAVINRPMKQKDIERLIRMLKEGNNSGGHQGDGCTGRLEDGSRKKEWSNLAKRYLRMIAMEMGLVPVDAKFKSKYRTPIPNGMFQVHFNPGGPAVAGDVMLDTTHLHVCISGEPYHELGIMFRGEVIMRQPNGHLNCKMGDNRWMPIATLQQIDEVVQKFKQVHEDGWVI